MTQITDLAPELLNEILGFLWDTSFESFLAANLTCRTLRYTTRLYLWKNVSLPWKVNRNSAIAHFIENHHADDAIKTLRLQPQKGLLGAFKINMPAALERVDPLCACINSLPNLKTFSISIRGQVDSRCAMPGPVLAKLVSSLPASVVNLELDSEGMDEIWTKKPDLKDPSTHLCHAIGTKLPQLETLSLGLSCLCQDLFHALQPVDGKQPTSKLRLAGIDLDISLMKDHALGVTRSVTECTKPTSKKRHTPIDTLAPDTLYKPALSLQAAGAFPHLQRFIFLTYSSERHYRVRDVAARKMTQYPVKYTSIMNFWNQDPNPIVEHQVLMINTHDSQPLYGNYDVMAAALMHEVGWTDGERGSRVPPSTAGGAEEHRIGIGYLLDKADADAKRATLAMSGRVTQPLPNFEHGQVVKVFYHPVEDLTT